MKRFCSCLAIGVGVCLGWMGGTASACPVTTSVSFAVPVAQVALAQAAVAVPVAVPAVAAPIVAAPILAAPVVAAPVVAAPIVAAPIVVNPPVAVAASIAVPGLSVVATPLAVVSTPLVERVRIRSPRRFRTPVRSLLFR